MLLKSKSKDLDWANTARDGKRNKIIKMILFINWIFDHYKTK
jgi:hypothetical protein